MPLLQVALVRGATPSITTETEVVAVGGAAPSIANKTDIVVVGRATPSIASKTDIAVVGRATPSIATKFVAVGGTAVVCEAKVFLQVEGGAAACCSAPLCVAVLLPFAGLPSKVVPTRFFCCVDFFSYCVELLVRFFAGFCCI